MARNSDISVGVDLGSSTITCVVLQQREGRNVVVGVGQAAGTGLSQGTVVHIEATVEAIRQAVEEAGIMSSMELGEVYTTIAGAQVQGFSSHGMVEVPRKEVRREDMEKVLAAARSGVTPQDQCVVHVIPQDYVVDGQGRVADPEGMSGVCLESWVHLITAPSAAVDHSLQAFQRCGLKVRGIIVQQVAAAKAVLTEDEKELGVCLLDLGAASTKMAVFHEGALVHTAVFPLGGDHVTSDLAQALRTVREEAERIKQRHGVALAASVDPAEVVTLPAVGGRPPQDVARAFVAEVIEARLEEILVLVYQELERAELLERLTGGVVLTGGTALLRGVEELAHQVLDLPVRVGSPQGVEGLRPVVRSPRFATAVGLAMGPSYDPPSLALSLERGSALGDIFRRARTWLSEVF